MAKGQGTPRVVNGAGFMSRKPKQQQKAFKNAYSSGFSNRKRNAEYKKKTWNGRENEKMRKTTTKKSTSRVARATYLVRIVNQSSVVSRFWGRSTTGQRERKREGEWERVALVASPKCQRNFNGSRWLELLSSFLKHIIELHQCSLSCFKHQSVKLLSQSLSLPFFCHI